MKKRGVIILFSALLFMAQTCAGDGSAEYHESLKKWRAGNVSSYYLKVRYSAFSPLQGEWEIFVADGRVIEAKHNGIRDSKFISHAERFTVDSIYKASLDAAGCDEYSPMCTTVEFSRIIPYIKSVKRMNNRLFKGNLKKDAGYSIVVVEFRRG